MTHTSLSNNPLLSREREIQTGMQMMPRTEAGAAGARSRSFAKRRMSALGMMALGTTLLALSGCGDSKDNQSSASFKGGLVTAQSPCEDELMCGDTCSRDSDCPMGQFCKDKECYAECTEAGGECMGTCSDRGQCMGSLVTGVMAPTSGNSDGFIASEEQTGSSGSAGSGDVTACATGTAQADLKPVSMFIMFDRSLSMAQNNKWPNATNALISFLQNPTTADLGVALRFFGDDQPANGCNDDACDINACAQPLVDIGVLTAASGDAQETALVNAIQAADADFPGTPMYAALGGALQWAEGYQAQHADQQTVVVLVTDGEPRGCDTDINDIAGLAQDSLNSQGILTFAVGLEGSNVMQMDAIASAGGTNQGYFIGNGNAEQDLLNALNDIRGRALSCEFPVPTPQAGQTINPQEINVLFSSGSTGDISFGVVGSAAECGTQQAWYYDDPNNPSSIQLCDAACELALNQPDGALEVLIGCLSGSLPPIIMR